MTHSIILVLAISILAAILSSGIAKRIKSPQILGYIIVGVIIGSEGFNFFTLDDVSALTPLSFIALGVIGFLVGGEIEIPILRKYGKQFLTILLAEGIMATGLVFTVVFITAYVVLQNATYALALALLLGAISSATDPASTMGVIWEYRSAGILTTTLTAIVALDDVLAMALYAMASNAAQFLCGVGGEGGISEAVLHFTRDIGGAIVLGLISGFGLAWCLKKEKLDAPLYAALGTVLLTIGLAQLIGADLILATMTAGIVAGNATPHQMKVILSKLRDMSFPIYILFFVMVGARLQFSGLPSWMWVMAILYVFARNGGKVVGAYFGAKWSNAPDVVRQNTGLGLFSQGGVAIGLAIVAGRHLQGIEIAEGLNLGSAVVTIVTTTTFLIQLTGPAAVKVALKRANEMYKVLTKEDILAKNTIKGVMDKGLTCREGTSVSALVKMFSESKSDCVAVLNQEDKYIGEIRFSDMKSILGEREIWDWTVARDLVVSNAKTITSDSDLTEAFSYMQNYSTDQLCIVNNTHYAGILSKQAIQSLLRQAKLSTV